MASETLDEKAIFNVARQIDSPEARLQYLHQVCGSDGDLRSRVETLIRGYEGAASFLESPPVGGASDAIDQLVTEKTGTVIGRYKLMEEIGEGGMGVVYVAEQTEPVRRKVALKIIKPGMDSKQVIARFEAERQALALMDHPHIAHVHDGGATDAGRPYFVMELVRGVPITEFCDDHQLTTRQRLQLFVDVCLAIQHAHQKGIIHRDIKPSNVLVTLHDDKPVVKVIDFGVAKAINQELAQQTLYTRFAQMIGTPLYMSPEQAEMNSLDVDTRSDVYSLGVVLYELLTGESPLDRDIVDRVGFDEMRRMIREVDPPRPSHRISTLDAGALSTACQRRRVDSRQLGRILHGELDWIVMKALQKDRARRYESPGALAVDVQRQLRDEPVEACPPSRGYQLKKLILRHKSFFLATAAVMIALALGVIATSWQAVVATRASSRAKTAEGQAVAAKEQAVAAKEQAVDAEERATRHLQGALDAVDQMLSRVGDKKLKNIPLMEEVRYELLEDAVQLYDRLLLDAANDPQLQTEVAITERRKARVLNQLGRREEAREPIERSIQLLRKQLKATPDSESLQIELARSLSLAADVLDQLQPLEEAAALLSRLNSTGDANRQAVIELAYALSLIGSKSGMRGKRQRAEQTFTEAEQLFERLLSRDENDHELRRRYAKHLVNFGQFLGYGGNWEAEEEKLSQAVAIGQSLVESQRQAEDLLIHATALLNRGAARWKQIAAPSLNDRAASQRLEFTKAVEDLQLSSDLFKELVRDYPAVPVYRERLASTLANRSALVIESDFESALQLADQSLEILRRLAEDYPTVVNYRRSYGAALSNVANTLLTHDRELDRAESLVRQAIEQQTKVLERNAEDPTTLQYLANHYGVLAELLVGQGKPLPEVLETCVLGLRVAEPLLRRYPNNEFVSFVVRNLQEIKQDVERSMMERNEVEESPADP